MRADKSLNEPPLTNAVTWPSDAQDDKVETEQEPKKIAGHLNKDLLPLVEEPERFVSAVPYLFDKDFERW